jgi:hypothetical protein
VVAGYFSRPRPPISLVLGNQLLLARDPSYPARQSNRYRVVEHTIDAVVRLLGLLRPPTSAWMAAIPLGVESALDAFAGYVMLDAWIANQDRHHENWAALWDDNSLSLAPTFDHGASMARNISDEERRERLETNDKNRQIDSFARRARSAFYTSETDKKAMTTLDAWRAFARVAPRAMRAWLNRLEILDADQMDTILRRVPPARMSNVCREFTLALLVENRTRLLTAER